MAGRSGASEVVDLVDLEPDRLRDVVANQLEVGELQQVFDVGFLAGKEIIETNDVVALLD